MIYDGHAYCFPDQTGFGGFTDRDEFQKLLQLAMARHFQPVWKKKDRTPSDNSGLIADSPKWHIDANKDAQFRAAGYGRFEWTVDGEDFVKQIMPPSVIDMSYPADRLIAEMDYAGVDWALLHRTPYLGISNQFIAESVQRFPKRLQGLAYIKEWLIETETDKCIEELETAINQLGLSGLQFLPSFLYLYTRTDDWTGVGFRPFWKAVANLGIPVFFTLFSVRHSTETFYLNEMKMLRKWMEEYPDIKVVLTHGFDWRFYAKENTISLSDELLKIAPIDNPNFNIQLLFAILMGRKWDYPMPQIQPVLEKLVSYMGPERLIWGTDIPMVMRYYTYRQTLNYIRLYSNFLSDQKMDLIVGGNMARLMDICS